MEITIPVNRDARTFEQSRKDMLTNLERRKSERVVQEPHVQSNTKPSSTMSMESSFGSGRHSAFSDDWDQEVDRWINESNRRWNEDISRMRQGMFALQPVDDFQTSTWNRSPFDDFGNTSSIRERMDRQMEEMRQQMGNMSIPRGGSSSISTSSSKVSTSSSRSSHSGDPSTMKTESNTKESVQHSRTVNGVTTGTSSQSSMSTKSTGPETKALTQNTTPGALLPRSEVVGGEMNFLKDAYELGEDGQLHFKVHFDAKDFAPEDIEVTTVNNQLSVHAKKAQKSGGSESMKEFSRTVDLPRSIDHDNFGCNLTDDGVLILDAPVKAPDYDSITFDRDHQLSIRPKERTDTLSSARNTAPALNIIGKTGPVIVKDSQAGNKLHLEVPIESTFHAEDLSVKIDGNRLIVSGKQRGGYDEFTRSFDIPGSVDPLSVTAQLHGTTLIIEAPLLTLR